VVVLEISSGITVYVKEIEEFLTEDIRKKLSTYTRLLLKYNSYFNLTAILEPDDIFMKHYMDSLSGLMLLKKIFGNRLYDFKIVDVGTGAGFPGMLFKMVYPDIDITLIESVKKKVEFLKVITDAIETKPRIINKNVKEVKEKFDIFLSRGFSDVFTFIKKTKHMYGEKSHIFFYKGKKNKIIKEFNVVKNIKIGLNIKKATLYTISGFVFERNILELVWEKSLQ